MLENVVPGQKFRNMHSRLSMQLRIGEFSKRRVPEGQHSRLNLASVPPALKASIYKCKLAGGIQLVSYTANEGPERIQYKCMVTIYVFPEMKLRGLVISKTGL
jgi:hypothetical protein